MRIALLTLATSMLACSLTVAHPARAADTDRHCSRTASYALLACGNETADTFYKSLGACENLDDDAARAQCLADARTARQEGAALCAAQNTARRALCGRLGEREYDPGFDPADFITDFHRAGNGNRYFPLAIGNRWTFGGAESVGIEVLDATKEIEGVTCVVVRDQVRVNGALTEDTDDWFALANTGDALYCGEQVKDFEVNDADHPATPELVAIDGSFKTGRERAKPGIAFQGKPAVGQIYRQEFSLGNAEDIAEIVSIHYAYGKDPALDALVPRALAEKLCAADCIVVRETSPLDPTALERKYYAPGIGLFLGVKPKTGAVVQLTGCSFDSRCRSLPQP